MNSIHIRQKLIVSALTGAIMIPGSAITARASDDSEEAVTPLPVAGIESVLTESLESNVRDNIELYIVPSEEGEYLNRAFSNTSDYTYIRSAPDDTSEWIGKLYGDSAVTVLEYDGDWTKIRSGNVTGYVPAAALYTGEEARKRESEYGTEKARVTADVLNVRSGQGTDTEILTQIMADEVYPVTGEEAGGWYPVDVHGVSGWVSGDWVEVSTEYAYGETREEEEQRLAAQSQAEQPAEQPTEQAEETVAAGEENSMQDTQNIGNEQETQQVQEAASVQSGITGQAVIDYACQFIGNPYVWGGTSLTEGADCSGFVQSVYAYFGISLPRTTWDMENAGYEVSYEEAQPGDLILYDGHVGLYMGDGTIVNAMNEADGIGICSATYAPIITVRRVL